MSPSSASCSTPLRHRRRRWWLEGRLGCRDTARVRGRAAGCLDGPRSDYALFEEPIYAEYRTEMTKNLAKSIRDGGHTTGAISFPDMEGAGPLQLLVELDEDTQARAAWTKQLLSTMENRRRVVTLPLTSVLPALSVIAPAGRGGEQTGGAAHPFGAHIGEFLHVRLYESVQNFHRSEPPTLNWLSRCVYNSHSQLM